MNSQEEQLQAARDIWNKSWAFFKKYHGHTGSPEIWEEVATDFEAIIKKSHNKPVCVRVMLAAFMLLEEEMR